MAKPTVSNYLMWIGAAVVLVLVFWAGCRCGKSGAGKVTKIDTIIEVQTDTVIAKGRPDTVIENFWRPYRTVDSFTVFERQVDTFISPFDTAALLSRLYDTAFYKEVIQVKNGTVIKIDTVTMNRISGWQIRTLLFDTTITKTVTLPPRRILYIGTSISGNRHSLFSGVGWDLAYKQRNDLMYGAGVRFMKGGNMLYEAQIKFPIRLKRKR